MDGPIPWEKLFATTVTSAKPREREYKLTDGAGLYLLVKPNGTKLWRLNYGYLGKQRTLSFGAWPDVGLAMRAMLPEENSFKLAAEEWVAKQEREGMAEITLSKICWLLAKAYPRIGNRPVAKISAQEVLAVLRSIEATGRYESARRMRSVLSRVFR